jgi:HEAT repeat protein
LSDAGVALLARLSSGERSDQRIACDEAISRVRKDPDFRRTLLDLLRDGEPRTRLSVAFVLFHTETPTLRLLPALLDALELDDGDLRWSAARMLTTLGRMQGEVFPLLLHETRHSKNALRRRMGLYVLRELGPEREEIRSTLLAALDDVDSEVRRAALSSLVKLTEPDRACLDRALRALDEDPDQRMRRIAAVVVPDLMGADPEGPARARASLERAARADDPGLARAASTALGRLETEG